MFRNKYRYPFIFLLALYSFLNILFTGGGRFFGFELPWSLLFATTLVMVFLVWEGNRLIGRGGLLEQAKVWGIHKLIAHFFLSILWVAAIVLAFTCVFELGTQNSIGKWLFFKVALGFCFRVNLFLHCVNAIVHYLDRYREAQLQTERLIKQHAEARFEALRNQINPHFLFNSFNALSTLVHKDANTAEAFINQLSKVYRYLLYNQDNRLVQLVEELAFIESYVFLLKIRFKDNLAIDINLPQACQNVYIAPATLQLLIENAIKHNIVSKVNPLHVEVFLDTELLVVRNNKQLKELEEPSTNLGLENIRERYRHLHQGSEAMVVEDNDGFFTVKIPLIRLS